VPAGTCERLAVVVDEEVEEPVGAASPPAGGGGAPSSARAGTVKMALANIVSTTIMAIKLKRFFGFITASSELTTFFCQIYCNRII
jgi:hypothetical protein